MRELSALQAWHSPSDWQRLLRIENTVGIGVFSVVECMAAGRIQPDSLAATTDANTAHTHRVHSRQRHLPRAKLANLSSRPLSRF
jgi:hypothetical protein